MREVLQGLLIAGVVAWTACLLAALWVRHRLRRKLRIDPAVRSVARTVWLVSPSAGARLHHRLRRVGAAARAASVLDPALSDLADDLVLDAVRLEPSVVAVARSGRSGATARRSLVAQVRDLERVAHRLTALSSRSATRSSVALGLLDRARALEAAREELDAIDLTAGLYSRV